MDFFDKIGDRKIILIIEMSIVTLIGIAHLILFFFIKKTDFNNIFDLLNHHLFLILVLMIIVA